MDSLTSSGLHGVAVAVNFRPLSRRLGLPVYIWRNKRVVRLSPKAVLGFSKSRRHK